MLSSTPSFGITNFALYKQDHSGKRKHIFLSEHQLVFILKGKKHIYYQGKTLEIPGGNAVLFKRGLYAMSEFISEDGIYEVLMIKFTDEFVRNFFAKYPLHHFSNSLPEPGRAIIMIEGNKLLAGFQDQYLQYYHESGNAVKPLLQLKLEELFLLLTSGDQAGQITPVLKSIVDQNVISIEFVMHQHLFEPITIEQLAALCGRSLSAFKREFQAIYGMPPKRWINIQRLTHAHNLFQHTNAGVAQVAYECGFENVSHFIRIYKAQFGHTPKAARTN